MCARHAVKLYLDQVLSLLKPSWASSRSQVEAGRTVCQSARFNTVWRCKTCPAQAKETIRRQGLNITALNSIQMPLTCFIRSTKFQMQAVRKVGCLNAATL